MRHPKVIAHVRFVVDLEVLTEEWWIVRLKCEEVSGIMSETPFTYIEERRVWGPTKEDAVAKAASQSNAPSVSGATVEEEKAA